MGYAKVEFCTPPVPGQTHEFYGNIHNSFIKLPFKLIEPQKLKVPTAAISIHSLAASGDLELLNVFLSNSNDSRKTANEAHVVTGLTPLHFASSRGHYEIIQCLVDQYSATIDLVDKEGESALLKAAYNSHYDIVKYLVSQNTNIHLKDKDGWTALHNACASGNLPICELLIESGAYVDVKSKMGHTPLINAASKGHTSIVEYLLDKAHANPLIKNKFGETAYDAAAAASESHICDILYRNGVNWWKMQYNTTTKIPPYEPMNFHTTVMMVIYENERSLSLFGLSKPQFSSGSLSKNDSHWSLYPSGDPCTKEHIQLPQKKDNNGVDWFWLTDWQIDYTQPDVDPQTGWQYAHNFADENWTSIEPTSGYGWVRRRRWVRVMKRRLDLLTGDHASIIWMNEHDDYLCVAQDITQSCELDYNLEEKQIQQLTSELRAFEEAVQVLLSGVKDDVNPYRAELAKKHITTYTAQIDVFNTRIAQLAPVVSTPITAPPMQRNSELAHELGFDYNEQTQLENDFDSNPWSRESDTNNWSSSVIVDFNEDYDNTTDQTTDNPQNTWELDIDAKDCRGCARKFGLLLRRHHCRYCGLIYCDRCSMSRVFLKPQQIAQDPHGTLESAEELSHRYQRVCDHCYAKLNI